MLIISENDLNGDISYDIKTIVDGKIKEQHNIRCKATKIEVDNKEYYLLFNRYYKLNRQVFNYINIYMDELGKASQTKGKTLIALKYLYSYLSIFNIELKDLTQDEASKFITFLVGQSQAGKDYTLEFKSIRSASSVNDYLSLIRNYIKYLNLRNHPLLNEGGERKIQNFTNNNAYSLPSFNFKVKEYQRNEVPKHITLEEYKSMLKYTYKKEDKRLMCIIRLMYESGLRVGEVLGLTFEDIVKFSDEQGTIYYKVILRNRISDKSSQNAKFLMKPKIKNDYQSKNYNTKGFGYNEMYISGTLYEALMDYIEEAHSEAQETHLKQWEKYTVTDKVDESFDEDNNFYIFINSVGKPLSNVTLNQNIKDLFMACDVKLNDDGCSSISYDESKVYNIITNNRFNQYPKKYSCDVCKTVNSLTGSYISYIEEETFLNNPNKYIDNAYDKSENDAQGYILCKKR